MCLSRAHFYKRGEFSLDWTSKNCRGARELGNPAQMAESCLSQELLKIYAQPSQLRPSILFVGQRGTDLVIVYN